MTDHTPPRTNGSGSGRARVVPLRPPAVRPEHRPGERPSARPEGRRADRLVARPDAGTGARPGDPSDAPPAAREPLWRDLVGDVLRRERLAQERTLKDVADAARISMPYLSEVERGRKEASSEVLAAAAHALGLGLGDLLLRAHTRLTGPALPTRRAGGPASRDGLCLAA
ncbi:helix-turn-helix transcriptional regulator [Streptomyces sp. XM83C]|uniref:Helix-turn-helix domain-containing protein n=1 Tax=Streptomyces thermocoprophilus TaxID=78356 RepID=A0ABV5V8Z3_9ACTN|nr:helix-turn-helix transcriptional regulator [Streptomyces sp. XM83C]MCK1820940.1 helix-turn-helix transcriptional regulator [Streptomyces sp. XM83C]